MYVANMVEVFREVRRVLRGDGTLWANWGDSYNGSGGAGGDYGPSGIKEGQPKFPGRKIITLKPKDLCMIPARCAMALQEDGWWLRSEITWCKKSAMPESVTDRPTSATEKIYLFSKSPRYFYDAAAVQEPRTTTSLHDATGPGRDVTPPGTPPQTGNRKQDGHGRRHAGFNARWDAAEEADEVPTSRNMRNFWLLGPEPFDGAHFAVFPTEIPRRAILAGTSPQACEKCGAPWRRVVERDYLSPLIPGDHVPEPDTWKGSKSNPRDRRPDGTFLPRQSKKAPVYGVRGSVKRMGDGVITRTVDWRPTYICEGIDGSGRCVVLDPFAGSGTTLMVAAMHGREALGCELNSEYIQIIKRRLSGAKAQRHLSV